MSAASPAKKPKFDPPLIDFEMAEVQPADSGGKPWIKTGTIYVTYDLSIGGQTAADSCGATLEATRPMTAIHIPVGYQPTGMVNVILYLHGYKRCEMKGGTIRDYLSPNRYPLRKILDAKKKNVVFIAPTLGARAAYGDLGNPAKATTFLKQMMQVLHDYGPHQGSPRVDNLILAAHSGGGAAMLSLAETLSNTFNIPECWAFDCMYGSGVPQCAPGKMRICDIPKHPHPNFRDLDAWKSALRGSTEMRWYNWAKDGGILRVYWAAGSGTLVRSANLELLSDLAFTPSVAIEPELYNDRKDIVPYSPRPRPKAAHDDVPKTFLGECLDRCTALR